MPPDIPGRNGYGHRADQDNNADPGVHRGDAGEVDEIHDCSSLIWGVVECDQGEGSKW